MYVDLLIRMFRLKRFSKCYGLTTMRAQVITRREAWGYCESEVRLDYSYAWTAAIVQMSVSARQFAFM